MPYATAVVIDAYQEGRSLTKIAATIYCEREGQKAILIGKGGADVHFVGKVKPLHLNATEAEALRDYLSGDQVMDIGKAA